MKPALASGWEISSNSGRENIAARLKSSHLRDGDRILVFELRCQRKSYGLDSTNEPTDDYELSFHKVAISRTRLSNAVLEFTNWLETPWSQTPRGMEAPLAANPADVIKLSLGVETGVISSPDKPVFRLEYQSFLINARIGFVTDQSCIRILRDSLATFLVDE